MDDLATAEALLDAAAYMTIATAGADGYPWATPVWFAPEDHRRFYWVSDPDARHSRNLAEQPQLSLVVFDTHAPIGTGQGVYMEAVADRPQGEALERGIAIFSRRSLAQGGVAWTPEDVAPGARLQLYRATATARWIGHRADRRTELPA
jgi:nitroimidazol reductase NimA-like FMN-containing flavoprotein (pyridoxamine 5'-phosphate oxidase superfamily)